VTVTRTDIDFTYAFTNNDFEAVFTAIVIQINLSATYRVEFGDGLQPCTEQRLSYIPGPGSFTVRATEQTWLQGAQILLNTL